MAEILASVVSYFTPSQSAEGETELLLDSYGSLERANLYFDNRLRNRPWKRSSVDEKNAALREATEQIDRLNFSGDKTDEDQNHAFPRDGDLTTPTDIEKACYEIALKLVDGFDPELEISDLTAVSRSYGSNIKTVYERDYVLEHLRAGIPSAKAWALLKPYLADGKIITLVREN